MLVQLDVKDVQAMTYAYDILSTCANAAGVPAMGQSSAPQIRNLTFLRVVHMETQSRAVPNACGVGTARVGPEGLGKWSRDGLCPIV